MFVELGKAEIQGSMLHVHIILLFWIVLVALYLKAGTHTDHMILAFEFWIYNMYWIAYDCVGDVAKSVEWSFIDVLLRIVILHKFIYIFCIFPLWAARWRIWLFYIKHINFCFFHAISQILSVEEKHYTKYWLFHFKLHHLRHLLTSEKNSSRSFSCSLSFLFLYMDIETKP